MAQEIEKFEKKLAIAALMNATMYGVMCAGIALAFTWDTLTLNRLVLAAIILVFLLAVTEYHWFYKTNLRCHRKLLDVIGEPYKAELEEQLRKKGMFRLHRGGWFRLRYDKAEDDGLISRGSA